MVDLSPVTTHIGSWIVGVLTALSTRKLEPKVDLVWWSSHEFTFNITELDNPVTLHTNAITIQNFGRKAAEHIEIIHRVRPDHFKLDPALVYSEETTPAGEYVIRLQNLAQREYFTLEFFNYVKIPELLVIRSAAGHARPVTAFSVIPWPTWRRRLNGVLNLSGAIAMLYALWQGVSWLVGRL